MCIILMLTNLFEFELANNIKSQQLQQSHSSMQIVWFPTEVYRRQNLGFNKKTKGILFFDTRHTMVPKIVWQTNGVIKFFKNLYSIFFLQNNWSSMKMAINLLLYFLASRPKDRLRITQATVRKFISTRR